MADNLISQVTNVASWVSTPTWLCLQYIANLYLNKQCLYFYFEDDCPPLNLWPAASLYKSTDFTLRSVSDSDAIMVLKNATSRKLRGIRGRVIVIINELGSIAILWTVYKYLDIVILHPVEEYCDVYSWCEDENGNVVPKLINRFKEGMLKESGHMFPSRLPEFYRGRTVKAISNTYPLFSYVDTKDGPEDEMVKMIADNVGFKINYVTFPDPRVYYQLRDANNGPSGFLMYLHNRSVDFSYACLFVMWEIAEYAEGLPPYGHEPLTWNLAAPKPKSLSEGVYSGFGLHLWGLIVGSALLYMPVLYLVCKQDYSIYACILSAYRMLFSQSFGIKCDKWLSRTLLMVYSLFCLHVAWIYQSTLLINLFQVQFEKEVKTFDEAVKAGLIIKMHDNFQYLIPDPPKGAWKEAQNKGKLQIFSGAYDLEAVIKKRNILMLSPFNIDRRAYQDMFPKVALDNTVRFLKVPAESYHVTLYLPFGHPLIPLMSAKVLQIIESGIFVQKYKLKQYFELVKGGYKQGTERPLKIENFILVFQLVIIIYSLSLSCFVLEIVLKKSLWFSDLAFGRNTRHRRFTDNKGLRHGLHY